MSQTFPDSVKSAKVLIDGPSELVFDYAIPEGLENVTVGCRVRVPLRNRNSTGTILDIVPQPQTGFVLRPLHSLIDPEPLITPSLMKLGKWLADYYGSPMEQVMRALLPVNMTLLTAKIRIYLSSNSGSPYIFKFNPCSMTQNNK